MGRHHLLMCLAIAAAYVEELEFEEIAEYATHALTVVLAYGEGAPSEYAQRSLKGAAKLLKKQKAVGFAQVDILSNEALGRWLGFTDDGPSIWLLYGEDYVGKQLQDPGLEGPTLKGGFLVDEYYGGTEVKEMAWWLQTLLAGKNPIHEELHVLKPGLYRHAVENSDNVVTELDDDGVSSLLADDSNVIWILEFYSDRCAHCKELSGEVIEAARLLPNVRFAAVNARIFGRAAVGIREMPTFVAFYKGEKLSSKGVTFLSNKAKIVKWANSLHERHYKEQAPVLLKHASLSESTWFFLHTLAAKFPERPKEADRTAVLWQLASLAENEPCGDCAERIKQHLMATPPLTDSRANLSKWTCDFHNALEGEMDCSLAALDAVYLKDCGDCSLGAGYAAKKTPDAWDGAAYVANPAAYIASRSV